MSVHGLHYRAANYRPTGALPRLWPLARLEYLVLFRTRVGIALFLFCCLPSLKQAVLMLGYLGMLGFGSSMRGAAQHAPAEMRELLPIHAEFYVEPYVDEAQGLVFLLVLTAMATARAVAKDRATNALELYWTRGISPVGYFAAKWFGSFLLVAQLLVLVPLCLWLTGVLAADDWTFLGQTFPFVPGALAGLLAFATIMTVLCCLVSAIAATANLATILWCLLLGGSSAVARVLGTLSHSEVGSYASVWGAAAAIARACAGIRQPSASLGGAAMLLLAVAIVLALLARRRLRITEALG